MSLPADARVSAVQGFARRLAEARQFLQKLDPHAAPERFERLQALVQAARVRLSTNPEMGRPATSMQSSSRETQALRDAAKALGTSLGLSSLRELVIYPYVLLYAHDERRVVLLSLRHERQLTYRLVDSDVTT